VQLRWLKKSFLPVSFFTPVCSSIIFISTGYTY
jgi:hypothetical protein